MVEDVEADEHVRVAALLQDLSAAGPGAERLAVLDRVAADPDPYVATTILDGALQEVATTGTPEQVSAWAARWDHLATRHPWWATRVSETVVLASARHGVDIDASTLATSSHWLQQRLAAEAPDPVRTWLSEHGRTRRIRAAARGRRP